MSWSIETVGTKEEVAAHVEKVVAQNRDNKPLAKLAQFLLAEIATMPAVRGAGTSWEQRLVVHLKTWGHIDATSSYDSHVELRTLPVG